jgi:AraC-like DNA-binding protein
MKSTFLNLHEIVILLTLVELFFLCIALLFLPTKQRQPRNLLVVFFLLVFGTLSSTLLIWNSYLQTLSPSHWVFLPLLLSMCLLLQGPVLYFYLRSLSSSLKLTQWRYLLHGLPALLAAAIVLVFKVDVYAWLPWNWQVISAQQFAAVQWLWALVKCLPLGYVLACFYTEYRLRQQLKQRFSSISTRELRLAEIILGGFFIHWLWSFVGYFLGGYLSPYMNDLVGIINNYLTVILVNSLFVFALYNTRQLFQVPLEPLESLEVVDDKQPAPLDLPDHQHKVQLIERAISEQRLHLESQVNLERFAEQINLKPRELSALLNSHYKQNFFEFINGHRVGEAKRLLAAPECAQDTILDIIYRSGFNSQSAFHRFFKRLEGVTPSEYRKTHLPK